MSILDPRFKYVPSTKTDIAATFRRIRRELAEQKAKQEAATAKVTKIGKAAK